MPASPMQKQTVPVLAVPRPCMCYLHMHCSLLHQCRNQWIVCYSLSRRIAAFCAEDDNFSGPSVSGQVNSPCTETAGAHVRTFSEHPSIVGGGSSESRASTNWSHGRHATKQRARVSSECKMCHPNETYIAALALE